MRPVCSGCGYIQERCLCDVLRPVFNHTMLIVLQHPEEKKHALNTVRIMEKSFQNLKVFRGEDFRDHEELHDILRYEKTALLFPGPGPELLTVESGAPFTHLILLDGTWKKAKKIFYSNPFLQSLPKLLIEADIKSRYKIRQSSFKNSFSTLEAAVAFLSVKEPGLDCGAPLNAFTKMIDFQIEKMGPEVFEQNYLKSKSENKKGDD